METNPSEPARNPPTTRRSRRTDLALIGGAAALLLAVTGLYLRAAARANHEALDSAPKPVSVARAASVRYRPARHYVGTLQPWNAAKVGPQYVAAYVGTVLVRPGAAVRRGDVLATLDCRGSSAEAKEIAARARALEQRQTAAANEARRVAELVDGGFTSTNEAEQLRARSAAEAAEVEGLRASLANRNLAVDDCVLRAPFPAEVSDRLVDPGTYVRPGSTVVTLIDRNVVRLTADAPESDFAVVAPGTPVAIHVLATGVDLSGRISRRAPAADEETRTVHFEIDLPNSERALPVGTTATLTIDVGDSHPATAIPLRAATLRGDKASMFVVEGQVAKRKIVRILGEAGGTLYLDPSLPAGTAVVIEGRALLDDGDTVAAKDEEEKK